MSLVYAFRCDGYGLVLRGLPGTWTGGLRDMEHFCDSRVCQEKAKLRDGADLLWETYATEAPVRSRKLQ